MVDRTIPRRSYLKFAGAAGMAGLSGCIGGDGGDQTGPTDADGGSGGTTTSQPQTGGTVHFLNDRGAREVWGAAAEEFNSQSDYELEITWLPKGTSTNEQLAKMQAAGNMPALIFETSADCYSETAQGLTEPLTDVVEELGVKDTVNVDGESYMVPGVAIPLNMVYRADVVEGEPRSWSEWQAEAERIQADTGQSAYVVPSGRTNAATTHTNQILWNGGVDPYSGTGDDISVDIDTGEPRDLAIEAFEWLQTMNDLGPQASGWEWGDLLGALIQEQLVAWAGLGGLAIQELLANRPELATEFTPAPYPVADDQEPTQWWSYFEGMYSYREAENTEGAKEFLTFFMESDYYFEFVRGTAPFNMPTSKDGLRDDRYASAEVFETHPEFLDLAEDNWEDMAPVLNTGDDGAPNIIAANAYSQQLYGQAADQLLYGGRSPEETVDWLAEKLRAMAP